MYEIFNKSKFLSRRKELRKSLTPQELKLWFYLKGKNLGVKFRRQHGIGPYIVDFYCKEKNLIIEIDGSQHMDAKEYDKERDDYVETLGIKVLRFWNNEIDTNIEGVLKKIKITISRENP
jgi:very-short-patch-repair endonuclease